MKAQSAAMALVVSCDTAAQRQLEMYSEQDER